VRITPAIADILEELGGEVGKLFPWSPDGVSHHFMRTARRANLKVRLHDLRHTFASHLLMSGVDLKVVGDIIGHKDLKATQIYAHLSQSYLDEAILKLDFADKKQTED
jgi:site-specific recombinase XerD